MAGPIMGSVLRRVRERQPLRRFLGFLLAEGEVIPPTTTDPEIVVPKGILRSRTILASMVAVVMFLLDRFGVDLPFTPEELETTVFTVGEVLGMIGATYFRMSAT